MKISCAPDGCIGPSWRCARNNGAVQITVPASPSLRHGPPAPATKEAFASSAAARALGALCLIAIVAVSFLLAASAAAGPSSFVRVHGGGWPGWIAGPYQGLGLSLTSASFDVFTLLLLVCYVGLLRTAKALPARAIGATIALAYLALMLGPPLLSQDVFGYLSFARLGALHGLDPYTHVAAEVPSDPSFPYIGWPFQHTPYGPLFTLVSYAVAQLGLAGGLWAFKAIAVLSSLGAVALIGLAAKREGHSGRLAAAFVGLNPVMLEFAVGGAHNDTITLLLVAAALAVSAGAVGTSARRARAQGADEPRAGTREANALVRLRRATLPLAIGAGFKITSGLLIPFLVLAPRTARDRLRVLADATGGLIFVLIVGAIGFGAGMAEFVVPLAEEQQQVASNSIPAEIGRLVGLSNTPTWWRWLFLAGFVCVLIAALLRTAKGTDWRVAAGWSTVALVISTAWLLPWYAIWALPLAAASGDRRLRIAVLVFCLYALAMRLPLTEPLLG